MVLFNWTPLDRGVYIEVSKAALTPFRFFGDIKGYTLRLTASKDEIIN